MNLTDFEGMARKHAERIGKETLVNIENDFKIALRDNFSKRTRLRAFLRGYTRAGRTTGMILDVIFAILPNKFTTPAKLLRRAINRKAKQHTMLKWIKKRLKEPTTYKGAVLVAGAFGLSVSPELWEAITVFVASGIGLIWVIEDERKEDE